VRLGIIGGGPGGYSAALRASRKGLDVTLFEKKEIGGVCLNMGCVPMKALVEGANLYHSFFKAKRYGFDIEIKKRDWNRIQHFKENAAKRLVLGVSNFLCKQNNFLHLRDSCFDSLSAISGRGICCIR